MSSHARVRPGWPLGAASTTLLAAVCVVLGVAGGLALHSSRAGDGSGPLGAAVAPAGSLDAAAGRGLLRGDAVWAAGAKAAPGFSLHDQSGHVVSLGGQHGRSVLLAFMDSHCKLLCTFEGPSIRRALAQAERSGAPSLIVVSVNPWEDTRASVRAAAARWGWRGHFHWLLGSPAQLKPIWDHYGIGVQQASGDINHSSAIYLIDASGFERAGFDYPFSDRDVARDLRLLSPPRSS